MDITKNISELEKHLTLGDFKLHVFKVSARIICDLKTIQQIQTQISKLKLPSAHLVNSLH